MSISSRSYSNDVIKYGDVEKEREIEKRLKELGLWESKVHQEKEAEKMLDDHIENSDKLSQVIRRARRRRERSVRESDQDREPDGSDKRKDNREPYWRDKGKDDKITEGMKTMDEIRNIVKPSIIRDKSGIPLAYHIDVTMGCFTYDVTHHMTNDGYQVVLFGATSPSNPLTAMSFLSSKSLPSLFSPTISPRAVSPQRNEVQNGNLDSSEQSPYLGSTLRYRRERDEHNENDLSERKTEEIVTDVRRLTKEISVELPKTVDVSQLIVDYRKGIFKIRVPFFLQSPSSNQPHQPLKSIIKRPTSSIVHHSNDPSQASSKRHLYLSHLEPIKCQISSLSSSSPSSPSLLTRPISRTSRTPSSPLSPNNKAFHCSTFVPSSKSNLSESIKDKSTDRISQSSKLNQTLDNQSKRLENLSIATSNQFSFSPSSDKKYLNNGLLTVVQKDTKLNPSNISMETTSDVTKETVFTNGVKKKTETIDDVKNETDWEISRSNPSNSVNGRKYLELKNFFEKKTSDVSVATVDLARYNGVSTTKHLKDVARKQKDLPSKTIPCDNHTITDSKHYVKVEHDFTISKDNNSSAKFDLKTISDQDTECRSYIISDDKINISSLDDLVSLNSAWSNDEDLESLLKQCIHPSRRVKRSRTEVVQNLKQSTQKNSKPKNKKKTRSKSLPGLADKSSCDLRIFKDETMSVKQKGTTLIESPFKKSTSREANFKISANNSKAFSNSYDFHTMWNVDSILDLLEESNI